MSPDVSLPLPAASSGVIDLLRPEKLHPGALRGTHFSASSILFVLLSGSKHLIIPAHVQTSCWSMVR